MTNFYAIKRPSVGATDFMVAHIATGKVVFYGSKAKCREWIERNGHDEDAI